MSRYSTTQTSTAPPLEISRLSAVAGRTDAGVMPKGEGGNFGETLFERRGVAR